MVPCWPFSGLRRRSPKVPRIDWGSDGPRPPGFRLPLSTRRFRRVGDHPLKRPRAPPPQHRPRPPGSPEDEVVAVDDPDVVEPANGPRLLLWRLGGIGTPQHDRRRYLLPRARRLAARPGAERDGATAMVVQVRSHLRRQRRDLALCEPPVVIEDAGAIVQEDDVGEVHVVRGRRLVGPRPRREGGHVHQPHHSENVRCEAVEHGAADRDHPTTTIEDRAARIADSTSITSSARVAWAERCEGRSTARESTPSASRSAVTQRQSSGFDQAPCTRTAPPFMGRTYGTSLRADRATGPCPATSGRTSPCSRSGSTFPSTAGSPAPRP